MHATQADACMYYRDRTYLYGMNCMHCPVTSQSDACRYCMGSKVSSLSQIYLYFSYFAKFGAVSIVQNAFGAE